MPNVDWCEDHKEETIRSNVLGLLTLVDTAFLNGAIHVTNFATGTSKRPPCTYSSAGCIYEYDVAHPMYSGKGFTEQDNPNFDKSFYSKTKGLVEKVCHIP